MGALHKGHLSLVERAGAENDRVIVSIFVNPTQFNDPTDLKNYPRTLDNDLFMLTSLRCDYVFSPEVNEIYPEPDTRRFDFGALETVMEREKRLYANLDLYAAPVLHLLGLPADLNVSVFAASRISGWCAHVIEQHDHNRLIRPRCLYTGPAQRSFTGNPATDKHR